MDGTTLRDSPRLLTLVVVAATLVGIIGLELREVVLDEVPAPIAPTRQPPEEPPAPGWGTVSSDQVAQYVAIILARPLFSSSRRPPAIIAEGTTTAGLTRLTGVVVSPGGKSAIFAGPANGKPVVVGEGAHIGAYVVRSIDIDTVTVTGPGGQHLLHPAFDPNPPPPPAPLASTLAKAAQSAPPIPPLPPLWRGRQH